MSVRGPSRSEDTAHLVCQLSIYNSLQVIRTTIAKNRHFYVPVPRPSLFVCRGDAPAAITQNVACKKSQFSRTAAHIFVSPGDAPAIITQYLHGWKDNLMLVKPLQHVPIYLQQFPSYSNRKCKKSPFSRTAAHIFVSPGDAPATITRYVPWMKRQFNSCQTPRSMYLSILNTFRVIRCLSQCVSPKIANFTTFLFPLGTPLRQSR